MAARQAAASDDAILGGRLMLRQPLRGHRVGHDAVFLAAAVAAAAGDACVDLGAGVGASGLALARRVEGATVTLVEIDAELTALAAANAERNALAGRVRAVCLDVEAPAAAFAAAALPAASAAHVLMNSPFNAAQHPSPDRARRTAHVASEATLRAWLGTAARLLPSGGDVTLIWRADGLADVLAALAAGFGAVTVLPLHPKPAAAAIRVLVRAVKGSGAPLAMLPGLVLADTDGKPTAEAEAVLRGNAALVMTKS
jgi:tRNA1(Val) A37 N6-methylase TrmN6